MAKRGERIYKMGGADPRSGEEKFLALINRMAQPKLIRQQNRRWDDSDAKLAADDRAAQAELRRRGRTSGPLQPRPRKR